MRAWLALFSAIAFEVTGTLTLKLSALGHYSYGILVTYLFLALSYALLSVAFRRIPVAVAFAVWEAAGLALVTVAGVVLLGEHLSPVRLLALLGLGLGAWLLHGGTVTKSSPTQVSPAAPVRKVRFTRSAGGARTGARLRLPAAPLSAAAGRPVSA
ncbi:DMT family transporter [Deinococcus altitudinis]|uniref:DMT family transporter n=1 Tax=Deinococcus altitudinis TaxID=468914 RepID=UPI0038915DE1